jgi:hypothetical protein
MHIKCAVIALLKNHVISPTNIHLEGELFKSHDRVTNETCESDSICSLLLLYSCYSNSDTRFSVTG